MNIFNIIVKNYHQSAHASSLSWPCHMTQTQKISLYEHGNIIQLTINLSKRGTSIQLLSFQKVAIRFKLLAVLNVATRSQLHITITHKDHMFAS